MNRQKTEWSNYSLYLICLLWFIPLTLSSQRYISGQVTDAEDKEPVPGASVFISNTTIGITTDAEGNYRLGIPGEGSYQLTISHVGYQAVFHDIEPGKTSVKFDAALQSIELEELTVATKVRFRQRDINLFWKTVLGKNPSRRTIHATNPEAVYYYYNPETRILKVTCREPLQIVNYETGYRIQYVLNYFTHDYNTDITNWSHHYNFTELKPEDIKQQTNWEKKRQEVHRVSLTKFIKSLYNNTLYDDGFILATFRQNADPKNPYQISLSPNRLLIPNRDDNSKTLSFLNEQVMLLCYGRPVTENDLSWIQRTQGSGLLQSRGLLMNLLYGDAIRIYPDGTYMNKLGVAAFNTSISLSGLSMTLPLEYLPDGSTPAADDLAENRNDFDNIVRHFTNQLSVFPQEKIHLHTDRDVYVSGEKIWFKAYVTDALTHQFPTPSRYVYVELISPVDTLMHRVMIRQTDDMFYGNLPLTEYVPTGNYTLRAYTRYMENLGDDYFFKKNIRIENLATPVNQQRPTASRGMLKDDFSVSFFPEGGNLPEGILSKIAFKAININGYPETVSGKLMDENGIEIASVETFHAGMGVFEYIPETGKKIFLKCKNAKGLEKQFALPQPNPRAYALSAYQNENDLLIEVNRSVYAPVIPCYLLVHCRGAVLYFSELEPEDESVLFDAEEFPAGVIQFVLFDKEMNPLSERLVFSKNYDNAKVAFHTDKTSYEKRQKVVTSLSLTPSPVGRAGEGWSHLSVAITDDKDISIDESTTILSSLLLSSELRGYIENPAWYLQDNPESTTALDYLMLTHGWRRYSVPEVIKGNPKTPQIPFQLSQEIAGSVKNLTLLSKSLIDNEITILTRNGDFGLVSTDEKGSFVFQDFEYPDSTSFFIQALGRQGSSRIELVLNRESYPKLIHAILTPTLSHLTPALSKSGEGERESNAFIVKAEQRSKYDEDMWVIHLGEVEVTASRIEKKDEPRLQYWANAMSDATIRREEIERRNPRTVTAMLNNIAGVSVLFDGKIIIRESRTIREEGENNIVLPLVLIDGVPVDWSDSAGVSEPYTAAPLETVSVNAVESIDVFKGASAAAFGVRGAGGVISITTRRGGTDNSSEIPAFNYTVYTPLGYQKPVEFYSPKYETLESTYLTIPDFRTTIFWKPDVVISESGEASFEFYTSDFPTTYSVVIEGITTDGKIVRQVEKIRVE